MTEIVKFTRDHLTKFFVQPKNSYLKDWVASGHVEHLEKLDTSYTALVDGDPILCGGFVEIWPGRAQAWTVFDQYRIQSFIIAFRILKRFLDECPIRRIEIAVDCGVEKFHRRAGMLGFKLEAPRMEAFLSNGQDCALYARVRN